MIFYIVVDDAGGLLYAEAVPVAVDGRQLPLVNRIHEVLAELNEALRGDRLASHFLCLQVAPYRLLELLDELDELGAQQSLVYGTEVLEISLVLSGPHQSEAVAILEECLEFLADQVLPFCCLNQRSCTLVAVLWYLRAVSKYSVLVIGSPTSFSRRREKSRTSHMKEGKELISSWESYWLFSL